MNRTLLAATLIILSITSCQKTENKTSETVDFDALKTEVLHDFTNKVAIPNYADLDNGGQHLFSTIETLKNEPTEQNLSAARQAWKDMRAIWEQCEGFLFGPVEDNDYDPNMDTWPTDYVQMDSLLNSNSSLSLGAIQQTTLSLRGYHPIEYILFGNHGNRLAASITDRQKTYMLSLAEDLKKTCNALHLSWTSAPQFYSQQVMNAGDGSTVFSKKQEVYLAIVEALTGICEEVGAGKMKDPFDTQDPTIVESPYSGNSIADFKHNLIGLQNVYLGRYGSNDGKGLNDLVAAKNKALDNKIQSQIAAAIASFDNITVYFEEAIFSQRLQVQQVMQTLETLQQTLDSELKPFILQYIQD